MSRKPKQTKYERKFKHLIGKWSLLTVLSGAKYYGKLYYRGPKVVLTRLAVYSRRHHFWQISKLKRVRAFDEQKIAHAEEYL